MSPPISYSYNVPWFRCSRVRFKDKIAIWSLRSTPYDLFEAYKANPHIQLINAVADSDLKEFVEKWGPLRSSLPASQDGFDPIVQYRVVQQNLAWKADLLFSIEHPERRRSVLVRFDPLNKSQDDLENFSHRIVPPEFVILPGVKGCDEGNLFLDECIPQWWLDAASAQEIESVCIRLATNMNLVHRPAYQVAEMKKATTLRAAFALGSLIEALDWMLWQDVYHQRPHFRCPECGTLFMRTSKREKEFCTDVCSRRKTTRDWQRRKREERKAANGTQEAR